MEERLFRFKKEDEGGRMSLVESPESGLTEEDRQVLLHMLIGAWNNTPDKEKERFVEMLKPKEDGE